MLDTKKRTTRYSFEQEWKLRHPHADDPPELKQWGPEHREFIFEQFMKIYNNTPKNQSFQANTTTFDPTLFSWVIMVIVMLVFTVAVIFFR